MRAIHAVYEAGVFRPIDKVDLPERTEVEFVPKVVRTNPVNAGSMDAIYEIMSLRFNTGEHDIAERHNEHQP